MNVENENPVDLDDTNKTIEESNKNLDVAVEKQMENVEKDRELTPSIRELTSQMEEITKNAELYKKHLNKINIASEEVSNKDDSTSSSSDDQEDNPHHLLRIKSGMDDVPLVECESVFVNRRLRKRKLCNSTTDFINKEKMQQIDDDSNSLRSVKAEIEKTNSSKSNQSSSKSADVKQDFNNSNQLLPSSISFSSNQTNTSSPKSIVNKILTNLSVSDQFVNVSQKCFMLSNISEDDREKFENIIINLGGIVINSMNFDDRSTHIVVEKLTRNEKVLCSIAMGNWVLHISYLIRCYEARTFLPEENFEWGNPLAASSLPKQNSNTQLAQLASASYRERCRKFTFGYVGPFKKLGKVCLVGVTANKISHMTRLLLAGKATIEDNPYKSNLVLAEEKKWNDKELMTNLAELKIPCVGIIFLADYLMKVPQPSTNEYLISPYESLLKTLG